MKPSYHNTNDLHGRDLQIAEKKAVTQEVKVLQFFEANPTQSFTPFEVQEIFPQYPITSIRRAMSNLTAENKLIKTKEKAAGHYGAMNFTWKLNNRQLEIF